MKLSRLSRTLALWAALLLAPAAHAGPWSALYIFGDSLSDSGNNASFLDAAFGVPLRTIPPLAGNDVVPDLPYASGRYTNNAFVWADAFAATLGLSNAPSRNDPDASDGSNYAFGGARTGPSGGGFPFSLLDQVSGLLSLTGGIAPADALYVVAGGGNDMRDAAGIAAGGGNPLPVIESYVANTLTILASLQAAGAEDILLWNVPDLGLSPAARAGGPAAQAGATAIAGFMNLALENALAALPDVAAGVRVFDVFSLLQDIAGNPADFGLDNVGDACAANLAVCTDPDTYLFWDGVHPTSAGHLLLARGALAALPEPGTPWLLLAAALPLLWRRGRAGGRGLRDSARS